jgi:hypothetical protein
MREQRSNTSGGFCQGSSSLRHGSTSNAKARLGTQSLALQSHMQLAQLIMACQLSMGSSLHSMQQQHQLSKLRLES